MNSNVFRTNLTTVWPREAKFASTKFASTKIAFAKFVSAAVLREQICSLRDGFVHLLMFIYSCSFAYGPINDNLPPCLLTL